MKQEHQTKVPKLRFREFQVEWNCITWGLLFDSISDKDHNSDLPILAITQDQWAIPRELIEFNISVTDKSIEWYKVVRKGDFIISLRSFQWGIEYSEYDGICSPAYIILRPNKKIVDYFFKNLFKTDRYITEMNRKLEWIRDWKMVSYKYFSEIVINHPSLPEQQKIASFFSLIDEKIEKLKTKKSLLEKYKKWVMQKIFSREVRFQDESGKKFGEWETIPLSSIATRVIRKNSENNLNVLTISWQQWLVNQEEYFTKSVSAKDVSNYFLIHKWEFTYNKSYSKGYPMGAIKCLERYEKWVVSTLYICFKFNKSENNSFFQQYFEYWLQNIELEKVAQEWARNHGLLNIWINDFFNINLQHPSLPEQQKIASCLLEIDNKINAITTKMESTEKWKNGLLQQMLV
jgi:type I restriction enzyme S subunit